MLQPDTLSVMNNSVRFTCSLNQDNSNTHAGTIKLKDLKHLLDNNQKWASSRVKNNPDYFLQLSKQQSPEYLWIGCSDSRVPANQITNLPPGEVFVHRNIANIVVHTDLNCLSVIQYAIDILKVKHIIVCGHYGCGGIKAAMENVQHGLVDNWLRHIKDVFRFNAEKFKGLNHDDQLNLLCELNVKEQVKNICNTSIVQKAWKQGQDLTIHGWIYNIENGILNDLMISTQASWLTQNSEL